MKHFIDNTLRIKQLAEKTASVNTLRPGHETYQHNVDDNVLTTSSSVIQEGIRLKIIDRMIDFGHCRYLAGGVWHRQCDIKSANC